MREVGKRDAGMLLQKGESGKARVMGSQLEPDWKVKRNKSCQLLAEEHSGLRSNKLREGMIDDPWFIPEIGGCQVPGMKCIR